MKIFEQECIPVGCVPPACWPYPRMHCAGGVSAWWGCLPGGFVCLGGLSAHGGVCPGVSAQRGVFLGGVYPSMQWGDTLPLWTDKHLWKHNLRKIHLRTVKSTTFKGLFTRNGDLVKRKMVCKNGLFPLLVMTCIKIFEQECIPVGCIPPTCWPYPSMYCAGGDCLGVTALGVTAWGVFAQGGVSQHAMGQTPPCGQTDTCENITFANLVCGR